MPRMLRELGGARVARAVALGFLLGFGGWVVGRCALGAELLAARAALARPAQEGARR